MQSNTQKARGGQEGQGGLRIIKGFRVSDRPSNAPWDSWGVIEKTKGPIRAFKEISEILGASCTNEIGGLQAFAGFDKLLRGVVLTTMFVIFLGSLVLIQLVW